MSRLVDSASRSRFDGRVGYADILPLVDVGDQCAIDLRQRLMKSTICASEHR
jgi:hypothetical protein